MCGIAGSLNMPKMTLDKVYSLMSHRGPNAKGILEEMTKGGFLQFFHARLSIQDLSKESNQPMNLEHLSIVFNGEIYNHMELRRELSCTFKTHSDTETILALYLHYGIDFLDKLDGMFAFVIFDRKEQKLVLARDRMGKKPLFYYQKAESFGFASELNTLVGIKKMEIDRDSLAFFLQSGFFYQDGAPYRDVFSLPNGHYGIYDLANHYLKIQSYFDLKAIYEQPKKTNLQESLEACETLLKQSIKNRLLSSDLEVGAFLSGGIDSSLIVALASEINPNLRTFTISFDGTYDESSLAEMTAKRYYTNHTTLKISTDLKQDIFKILQNYGRPFADSSAIPSYYVAREAKKYLSVILNGDGADELFGGYRRYVGHLLIPKTKALGGALGLFPKPREKKSLYNYFYRLLQMARHYQKDFKSYYLSATTDIFEGYFSFETHLNDFFNQDLESTFCSKISPLSQMLLLDSQCLLLSDLLPKMDIATMANSLEGRSPFLSKMLVEFAPALDDSLKIKGKKTKYLLRLLAQKYLDAEVYNAPKRGFEVPLKQWVNGELKEIILQVLQKPSISDQFLSKDEIDEICFGSKIPSEKRAKMLWSLFALEVWYQKYLEY
ncbi:asparagine synthase (glutamine-hydrolyzing) [Helicobacter colisuis]|uniref:asparagine synthase (glutamine-hydrolyzing) n=1 Tax=Helicobacter colisuis TaxID=2949739 RepID=UPI00202A2275|nr:asparagine synthase (glutamine-hydrolyzing) [Helicobacter colisuis]MCL9822661.1 asparagine synthase (glutamine-hydrolyzing) [Helicobacter colisuis]